MTYRVIIPLLWLTGNVLAQPLAIVSSSHDGTGLFSYTLQRSENSPYLWGFEQAGDGLFMRFYGVQEIFSPPGWSATLLGEGELRWSPTSGLVILDGQALTFSIRSSSSMAVEYGTTLADPVYPAGRVGGPVFMLDHQRYCPQEPGGPVFGCTSGFEAFRYIGPAVPEPSTMVLVVAGFGLVLMLKHKRKWGRSKTFSTSMTSRSRGLSASVRSIGSATLRVERKTTNEHEGTRIERSAGMDAVLPAAPGTVATSAPLRTASPRSVAFRIRAAASVIHCVSLPVRTVSTPSLIKR